MSENQQPNQDPLEEAIRAFQEMPVCERPADAVVLASFGNRVADLSRPSRIPRPSRRRYLMPFMVSCAAAAALLVGSFVLFRNSPPPDAVQVAATASPGTGRELAVGPPPRGVNSVREMLRGSLAQSVADAQVIVVATALGSAPAPPKRPGDLPEVLLRFRVKRVLKGKLADEEITTRTPTAAAEFIGKDWVVLLSPNYMAGKYQYAGHLNVKLEPAVKAILATNTQ
jgi:hypothetical protein